MLMLHVHAPSRPRSFSAGKLSATPREYSTPYQFRDDVRLVFDNCRLFNPPGL